MDLTIDHTLSWEVARVGGMLAYVLATGSVALGLLLSLGVRSSGWPRFITNELHRFVTLLTLVFIGIHSVAVFADPFTGFTPIEVLLPFAAHYRPLWIAMGIVSGYLALAVWASEYARKRIGYAWWRRLHYLAFAVFTLGALHGIGAGTDTGAPWALALYAMGIGTVGTLLGWRLVRALAPERRGPALAGLSLAMVGMATFVMVGPAQAGWNQIANNGNGNGASAAWTASHPDTADTADMTQPASFTAVLDGGLEGDDAVSWRFAGDTASGTVELTMEDGQPELLLALSSGWACAGPASPIDGNAIASPCTDASGSAVQVRVGDLRQVGSSIVGQLEVTAG